MWLVLPILALAAVPLVLHLLGERAVHRAVEEATPPLIEYAPVSYWIDDDQPEWDWPERSVSQ